MPPFSPGLLALAAAAALIGAWAAGLLAVRYGDGRLRLGLLRRYRVTIAFDVRDSWLLLGVAICMGWAVAAAIERSAWVPGTENRLVPALVLATLLGWVLAAAGISRLGYLGASIPATAVLLGIYAPSPLTADALTVGALEKWVISLPGQTNLLLLIGILAMFVVVGLWNSWWIFRRRNGLAALLPTGTLLAVEVINDTNPILTFYSIVWVASAAGILLRLNFVALKERWRARHLPRAADTGWTFGEAGVEATAAIILVSFLVLPPLSNSDISGFFVPGSVHVDQFHPFGIGSSPGGRGPIGSVGYSEVVRPGSQLKAKSQTVMIVSGDNATLYPYWRGIALAGWDGIQWYQLPSSSDLPVRQRPLARRQAIPRDDLPTDPTRLQTVHNTIRVLVPIDQSNAATIFSAGELISADDQPTTVRGIMSSSSGGDLSGPFDTVDRVLATANLRTPYTYSVTEAVASADVASLRNASTNYAGWLAPYRTLYQNGRTANGYSTDRDAEIARLAQSIVGAAGATNPYDQAKAIEAWFIVKGRFSYTLTPPAAPAGVRPLDYFLFTSHKGFCQDFSTAMNVMLRTLGIPSRQLSGFGQGSFDDKTRRFLVNSLDAHSWVEAYFPGYGWIPFEPTPDGVNAPVSRPTTAADASNPAQPTAQPSARTRPNLNEPPIATGTSADGGFPNLVEPLVLAGIVVLLLFLVVGLLAARWLMSVRDLPRIWRRLLFLGDRLRVPRQPGDTPEEYAGRLGEAVPPLREEVRALGSLYTRASFRRGGLDATELADARRSWVEVRKSYPGLVARAWREALRRGDVVSAGGAAASRNRGRRRRP